MNLTHLYALYRAIHCEYDHARPDGLRPAPGLPPVARAVAELAEVDAGDGRAARSLSEFRSALRDGAAALEPLGWSPA